MKKLNLISNIEFCGSKTTLHAYPVFLENKSDAIQKDLDSIKSYGIISSGRQGLFLFSSSIVSLEKANESVQELLNKINQNSNN